MAFIIWAGFSESLIHLRLRLPCSLCSSHCSPSAFPCMYRSCVCLRAFALTFPSACNTLLPDITMAKSLVLFKSYIFPSVKSSLTILFKITTLIYAPSTLAMLEHACVLSRFSHVWLFETPPGSSVHGILQAIILECVAMPSSRGSSWPRD